MNPLILVVAFLGALLLAVAAVALVARWVR